MIYLQLIFEFFKTGLFAVGGGLATLPFLAEMQETYGWFTKEELGNMIAISESTPGPIGINMSTYVGFNAAGIPGALTATLSLVLPSLIVICLIAGILDKFQKNKMVQDTFAAIRPAVTGLIAAAGMAVVEIALFHGGVISFATINWIAVVLFAGIFVCTQLKPLKKLHPAAFIALGAVLGIPFRM